MSIFRKQLIFFYSIHVIGNYLLDKYIYFVYRFILFFTGNLKVHFRINHDATNAMKCPHCEFASSSKRMYREHLKCHDMKDRQVNIIILFSCELRKRIRY